MTKCLICGNVSNKIVSNYVRDSTKHKIIQCKKCNHVQINPIPSRKENEIFYDNNQQSKNVNDLTSLQEKRKAKHNDTKRRIALLNKICKKTDKILEIGSGHGFFLEEVRKSGFNIMGIEVSKTRREISKKITKSKIINVNLMDGEHLDIGKFDVIVLFHVFEHISEQTSFLKNLKKILNKNGKIIIEVPNYDDFQIKLNKEYKKWFFQFAHIHYFTSKSLKKIFQKNGFKNIEIVGVQRYGIENMLYWKNSKKPQLKLANFEFKEEGYEFIDKNYKLNLESNLISDTLVSIIS
jgi:2-polyprenyl-3-methyl-5-hydroxy-6-metoxy-1,4-benzoquinol methylase